MRRVLAATLLAATAFTGSAFTGTAVADDGCVTDFLLTGERLPQYVEENPDGSYTVYPNRVQATANGVVAKVTGFVACVV